MRARDNVAHANDLQQHMPGDSVVAAATQALAMLADGTRLRLMARLLSGEADVTALTAATGASRPAVSQHLGKLRLAGLVVARRDGRRVVYAVLDEHVRRLVTEALYTAEHRVTAQPHHHGPRSSVEKTRPGGGSGARDEALTGVPASSAATATGRLRR